MTFRKVAAIVFLTVLTGCSGFSKQWKETVHSNPELTSLEGAWIGSWISERDAHSGTLQAIIRRAGGDSYNAHFHAKFWKYLTADYSLKIHVLIAPGGSKHFQAEGDLGRMLFWKLGRYSCLGSASGDLMIAHYESEHDSGNFSLHRLHRVYKPGTSAATSVNSSWNRSQEF